MGPELENLVNRQPRIQNHAEFLVSAVLLPLIEKPDGMHILFEVRAPHINRQPGEICFPGGKIKETEINNPQLTAVRETTEELGLNEEQVQIVGALDYLIGPMGFLVYPYVGKITAPQKIIPNHTEVKETFTVPVDFFLKNPPRVSFIDVATRFALDFPFEKVSTVYDKKWRLSWRLKVYFFEYEQRVIWGATAKIVVNFVQVCWPENIYYRRLY